MDYDDAYVQGFDDKDIDKVVEEFGSAIDDVEKHKLQGLDIDQLRSSGGLTLSGAFASLCISAIVWLLSNIFY